MRGVPFHVTVASDTQIISKVCMCLCAECTKPLQVFQWNFLARIELVVIGLCCFLCRVWNNCIVALLSCTHELHLDRILLEVMPSDSASAPFQDIAVNDLDSKANHPIISYCNAPVPQPDTSLFLCKFSSWPRLRFLVQLMSADGCSVFGPAYPHSYPNGNGSHYVWSLHSCCFDGLSMWSKGMDIYGECFTIIIAFSVSSQRSLLFSWWQVLDSAEIHQAISVAGHKQIKFVFWEHGLYAIPSLGSWN